MSDTKLPPVSRSLVEALEARYPLRRHRPGDRHDEIMFAAGQVAVVECLRREYERQRASGEKQEEQQQRPPQPHSFSVGGQPPDREL